MAVLGQVLGESEPIAAVREQVARLLRSAGAARRLPPVLILGETDTGKGLLADAIHAGGHRAAKLVSASNASRRSISKSRARASILGAMNCAHCAVPPVSSTLGKGQERCRIAAK